VDPLTAQKDAAKSSILSFFYQSYLFRQAFNIITVVLIQLCSLFVNITMTSNNSSETFVSNSLVVKAFPIAVMGLLSLNLMFNMFFWGLEIKFGQIPLKAKLVFSTLSAKSERSV
jgi:hypothetical protein